MAQRGQRHKLTIGGVAAEVALLKVSQKPREAQHETRRVVEEEEAVERAPQAIGTAVAPAAAGEDVTVDLGDPMAPPAAAERAPAAGDFPPIQSLPTVDDGEGDDPPAEVTIQRGATGPGGVWVDLTEQLDAIDRDTRLESMDVQATVARNAIPMERVRDAHYVAPAAEGAPKVLALLWAALRRTNRVAIVKWTKRTNQALGALVPRGGDRDPHFALLELEWSANMNDVPARARLAPALALYTDRELVAAEDLVVAWMEGPSIFEDLRDERAARRAELLEAARERGEVVEPAARETFVPSEAEALLDALAAA